MNPLDDFTSSVKNFYKRLAAGGKRTAAITRLRLELSGLDKRRREQFTRLGERIDELRRSGKIIDPGLLKLLEPEFESIDRLSLEITETMNTIKEINAMPVEAETGEEQEIVFDDLPEDTEENLIDSFEVL